VNFVAKIVGKNIRARREALGLSQTALSKLAKVSNVTISRIEAGTQAPQAISIDLIAQALGCSSEDLYQNLDIAPTQSPTIEKLLDSMQELVKENKELSAKLNAYSSLIDAFEKAEPHLREMALKVLDLSDEKAEAALEELRLSHQGSKSRTS
jgi:transcriptional regulator with XRE-family HTH domain